MLFPGGEAGFAFRRLSIIDLSPAGHQPMATRDRRYWIVFNGEVYNFAELRSELEGLGHAFESRTDTEVVLAAYREWGERCVARFIGMFAFAIWDTAEQQLFAARDRLGIKPFYYALTGSGIAFASELKALMASGLPGRALNLRALASYFARGYVTAPDTILASAAVLLPAHSLTWKGGATVTRRYWDPLDFVHGTVVPARSDDDWADELEERLRSAVRYRLISDVPLGAFLSGGVDSTLVAAIMRAVSTGDVRTFSIGFDHATFDESGHAAAVARHLGTTHETLTASADEALAAVPRLPAIFDEPFSDSSQVPTYLVSRLTREHVTVALSGDGGDELFCGYDNYRQLMKVSPAWRLPTAVRGALAAGSRALPGTGRLGRLAAESPLHHAEDVWRIWSRRDAARVCPAVAGEDGCGPFDYTSSRYDLPGLEPVERMMLSDLERYLPNDILTKVDRCSMATSLEARVPLLDHRVVEFALGLPLRLKWRNGTSKFLLRHLLERHVPRRLTDRPKQGFAVPLDAWLRGALRPLADRHLSPERTEAFGLLDDAHVAALRRTVNSGGGGAGAERLWSLLMLQLWLERNGTHAP